jgi:hypothetical protein
MTRDNFAFEHFSLNYSRFLKTIERLVPVPLMSAAGAIVFSEIRTSRTTSAA